jgi:uncharacterized membrane protein
VTRHAHAHPPARRRTSRRAVRFVAAVLAVAAALTVVAMIWLWPRGDYPGSDGVDRAGIQVGGQVIEVRRTACPADAPSAQICGAVTVRVKDKTVSTEIPSGPGAPKVDPGDRVTLIYTPDSPPDQQYQIMDHQRGRQLWFLLVAFALAVVAFGRWRGLAALAGLAVTFGVLLLFIVPSILDGHSPLLVAIVGSAAIMLSVLYLTNGINVTTTVAVIGTLASLTLTGILSAVATAVLHLTGVASEEDSFLSITNQSVNMQGLLLAGILIGSLGALDDMTVTQAATVDELVLANPSLSTIQLYRAAERVGRAHIASVVNTIILAYAGASLPLLLLIAAGNQPLGQVLTTQLIAQEITRSIIGTLGLIAAVPITTILAATFATHRLSGPSPSPASLSGAPSEFGPASVSGPASGSGPGHLSGPASVSGPPYVSGAGASSGPPYMSSASASSRSASVSGPEGRSDAGSPPDRVVFSDAAPGLSDAGSPSGPGPSPSPDPWSGKAAEGSPPGHRPRHAAPPSPQSTFAAEARAKGWLDATSDS